MRLALSTIADRLPATFGARLYDPTNGQELYGRPVLYEPGMSFGRGILYVTRRNALPDTMPACNCAIISVGTSAPWQGRSRRPSLLRIPHEGRLAVVFNAVQAIFDECDCWDETLRDEIEKDLDYSINNVLAIGTEFLGRPLNVVDQNLQVVLSTRTEERSDGSSQIVVDNDIIPLDTEINEQIKEVCRLERRLREPYFSALSVMGQSYCNNLYPLGYFAGCISITENERPFSSGELPLIDHFFTLFQKAYRKHLHSFGNDEESGLKALQNVLNHVPLSYHETELLSLAPGERWRCLVLRARKDTRSLPADYMHATLSGRFPKTVYATLFRQSVVGLVRLPGTTSLKMDPKLEEVGSEIGRMGYYGGVSNPFAELAEIDQHLLQAEFAVDRGRASGKSLIFFHDHALSYLLDACCSEMPAEAVMGQGLKNLLAYDAARGTEHVRTLDVYLRNETNVTRTARELYIHRSSLIKRLEKIKGVLQDDLEDDNHRLYYRLCLALIRRRT